MVLKMSLKQKTVCAQDIKFAGIIDTNELVDKWP